MLYTYKLVPFDLHNSFEVFKRSTRVFYHTMMLFNILMLHSIELYYSKHLFRTRSLARKYCGKEIRRNFMYEKNNAINITTMIKYETKGNVERAIPR